MVAASVGPLAGDEPARFVALAGMLALLVGAVCVLGGLGRLGFVSDFLSRPVLVGYMTGLALIIITGQLGKLLGLSIEADGIPESLHEIATEIGQADPLTIAIGLSTIGVLLVIRRWNRSAPAALVAVAVATIASTVFDVSSHGVDVVGQIPAGLPTPAFPSVDLDDVVDLLPAALSIALVTFSDGILMARSFGVRGKYEVDPNRELVALGTTNVASGLFGGFASGVSGSRSAVNFDAGAHSQMSGLSAAACTAVVLVALTPLLRNLPIAALGAIVIVAAAGLVEIRGILALWKIRRSEFALGAIAFGGVALLGILPGIAVAVIASILNLVRRASRPHDAVLGRLPDVSGFGRIETGGAHATPGIIVYRFDAPLFFANAQHFLDRIRALVAEADPPAKFVLLDAEQISDIDTTGTDSLIAVVDELHNAGIVFGLARTTRAIRETLEPAGVIDRIGHENIFTRVEIGVEEFERRLADRDGESTF